MNHHRDNALLHRFRQRLSLGVLLQRVLPLAVIIGLLGGSVLSCGDSTMGSAPLSPSEAYWSLQLNYQAVNMATIAPYDTVRLIATPHNVLGAPLENLGPATFQSSDSTVSVDSTGLMTAHFATKGLPTPVTVSLTVQGITLTQTVIVQVTDTIPQHALATFSMQPAPGDSAKRPLDSLFTWSVTATDEAHNTICNSKKCGLQIYYTSSNSQIAKIGSLTGKVAPQDTGHVIFTASTWAYGIAKQDSVYFTIGYRLHYTINLTLIAILGILTLGFAAPKKLILGVGAVVTFCNQSQKPVDVVFDQPTAVDTASCSEATFVAPPTGNGNIAAFGGVTPEQDGNIDPVAAAANAACRRFSVPGTYHYHSTLFPSDTFEIEIKSIQQ